MFTPEQFKPFVPNPRTKLGKAYLLTVKDCDGVPLLAAEAAYLRENPLLWLRGLSLYASNLDYLIRQSKTRLRAMTPDPSESQSDFLKQTKEHKRWSLVQEHRLHKIRARRAELVVEFGYTDIRDVVIVGDVVAAFDEILAAVEQQEWHAVRRVANLYLEKITGSRANADEVVAPVADAEPLGDAETLEVLLSRIRGERS